VVLSAARSQSSLWKKFIYKPEGPLPKSLRGKKKTKRFKKKKKTRYYIGSHGGDEDDWVGYYNF